MGLNKADIVAIWEKQSAGCTESFKKSILKATGRGGVFKTADYITANAYLAAAHKYNVDLRGLTDKAQLAQFLPKAYMFKLANYSPCLCARYDELKENQQKALFEKSNYLFTEKENGCRGWLVHSNGQWFLFSRNHSDVDCSVLDYWQNIYQFPEMPENEILALDVEVKFEPDHDMVKSMDEIGISTESKLEAMSALLQTYPESAKKIQESYKNKTGKDLVRFRLIYPLYFKGRNYMKKPLREGHAVYDQVIDYCKTIGLNVQPIKRLKGNREQKENFLNTLLDMGSEGVCVHNLNAFYSCSENRDKDVFIKIKRTIGSKSGVLSDSIDAFVTGFKEANDDAGNAGLVGALELSIYILEDDGRLTQHVITYSPNLTQEMRKDITIKNPDGTISMKEEMYNIVWEVQGAAISRVSKRLTHPRLLRMRFDKNPEECIYSRAFIESQMDNYR